MDATSLGFRALPSFAPPPTAVFLSQRWRLPRRCHRCALVVSLQAVRTFASVSTQEEDEEEEERQGPNSTAPLSNLSAEDLEQRLGKRRRSRKEKPAKAAVDPKPAPKDWDSMTLAEKTWEFYIGEKGALFWLNKLAYAAIFVVVGGWIAFRFIGPALNLYQLESPLLPPDQVLGGGVPNEVFLTLHRS